MLNQLETLFFDLDGCIWVGDALAPNAAHLVASLREAGKRVAFVSNVTSTTAVLVAERLTGLGIPATEADVMTPFTILPHHPLLQAGARVHLLGNETIRSAIAAWGLELTERPDEADVVVVSRDPSMTYGQLANACRAIYAGAKLIALNLDARVPVGPDDYVPGNGAIVAALTTATGVTAEAIGKPSPFFFEEALAYFGAERGSTAMVGDNLDSDIAGGVAAGLLTIQVGGDSFSQLREPPVPDHRVSDLFELERLLLVG